MTNPLSFTSGGPTSDSLFGIVHEVKMLTGASAVSVALLTPRAGVANGVERTFLGPEFLLSPLATALLPTRLSAEVCSSDPQSPLQCFRPTICGALLCVHLVPDPRVTSSWDCAKVSAVLTPQRVSALTTATNSVVR